MKTKLIIGILLSSILLQACESVSKRQENATEMSNDDQIDINNPFILTVEDLRQEQLELEKRVTVIKNSDIERNTHDYAEFKPELDAIDRKIDSLRNYISEFERVSTRAEQEVIYKQYQKESAEVYEGIEKITDRFDDLKKLDN